MLIDIYTDRNTPTGSADKNAAHQQGLWHRTFSCLVINPDIRTVLLQKKAPGRYAFDRPDYADFTVGGHYHAGESLPEGIRELREELGLNIAYQDLQPLGIRQTAVTLAPTWIEREFQYRHLAALTLDLTDIPLARRGGVRARRSRPRRGDRPHHHPQHRHRLRRHRLRRHHGARPLSHPRPQRAPTPHPGGHPVARRPGPQLPVGRP
ncbi:NUDIX domain-containing protein [Actinomadura sp. NEAU-AAG7]|nr:NUDIX domain-containing protein [Actinomadura sp. NEAU-AAG7]